MYSRKQLRRLGGASVSGGCWGEDGNHKLAGAAHFHVASPVLTFKPAFLNYLLL